MKGIKEMFLSVSIPVYNAGKYLNRCIKSIVTQKFDDYELILVNDGSQDDSLDVCYEWKNKYPNIIRVVNRENRGSLLARRVCLEESKGDYLYIMDADDYLLSPNVFQSLKNFIETYQCDLLFFNATNKENQSRYFVFPYGDTEIFEGGKLLELYEYMAEKDGLNALWNKVFSRKLVDWEIDYIPYKYIKNGTDMFQSIPIILNARKVLYINQVFYYYQTNDNNSSIVHKFNPYIYNSLKADFQRLFNELQSHNLLSASIKKKLVNRYMKIASTSAFKVRLLDNKEKEKSIAFLRSIGEDAFFREQYEEANLKDLDIFRKFIVKNIYEKRYGMLLILFGICRKLYK